jgi:hypothetical protein
MTEDDPKARYLETGQGHLDNLERLDLLRQVLRNDATWTEPPTRVADGLMAALTVESATDVKAKRPRRGLYALAAAVAILGVVWLAAVWGPPARETGIVAMITGTDLAPGVTGQARLEQTGSGWWISLDLAGLPPAPEGTYYQGWVWRAGEGVSIGTFHLRGGDEPVVLWAGVDVAEYPSIWVTLQDEGGGTDASDRVMATGEIAGLD